MTNWKPVDLNEVTYHSPQTKTSIFYHLDNEVNQPLLLHGPCGTGKSSIADLLTKHASPNINDFDFRRLEACDDRSNDYIKSHLNEFCKSGSMNYPHKRFVIIEELDELSSTAQVSLSGLINKTQNHVKFIFTTNHLSKVNKPLVSRSDTILIKPADLATWITAGKQIMANHGYPKIDSNTIQSVIEAKIGDNRKVITQLMKLKAMCDQKMAS